jgi:hypothetical protein
MSRRYEKVITVTWATAFLTAAVFVGASTGLAEAPSATSTVTEGIAIGGSVSNSPITNTIIKQDPVVLAAMVKTFADQMAATTEAKAQAEAKAAELAAKLGFTSAAVVEFFKILGEQDVPEEKAPARPNRDRHPFRADPRRAGRTRAG